MQLTVTSWSGMCSAVSRCRIRDSLFSPAQPGTSASGVAEQAVGARLGIVGLDGSGVGVRGRPRAAGESGSPEQLVHAPF